jgi:hypothetical protein
MNREKMVKIGSMTLFCVLCAACAFAYDDVRPVAMSLMMYMIFS